MQFGFLCEKKIGYDLEHCEEGFAEEKSTEIKLTLLLIYVLFLN